MTSRVVRCSRVRHGRPKPAREVVVLFAGIIPEPLFVGTVRPASTRQSRQASNLSGPAIGSPPEAPVPKTRARSRHRAPGGETMGQPRCSMGHTLVGGPLWRGSRPSKRERDCVPRQEAFERGVCRQGDGTRRRPGPRSGLASSTRTTTDCRRSMSSRRRGRKRSRMPNET